MGLDTPHTAHAAASSAVAFRWRGGHGVTLRSLETAVRLALRQETVRDAAARRISAGSAAAGLHGLRLLGIGTAG